MKDFARECPLSLDQPAARLFVWPLELMLRFNATIANALQENTVSWAQRRQEAAEDAVETFERLVHCRDIGEAVSIQQEWVDNNIRRLDEDFGALAHQGANLSRRAASTARDAVDKSAHAARAGARQAEEGAESMAREGEEAETAESGRHGRSRNHKRAA